MGCTDMTSYLGNISCLWLFGQQYRVGCSGASCVALIPLCKACVALVWPVWAVTSSCVCDHSAGSVADVGMSTVIEAGDYCGDHTCWCMASYNLRGIYDEILLL